MARKVGRAASRPSAHRSRTDSRHPTKNAGRPDARSLSKSRVFLFRLILAGCGLVVALAAAEIIVRVSGMGPQYWNQRRDMVLARGSFQRTPFGFVPYAVIRSVYPSNPRGYFDAGNIIDHEFNSAGWRDIEHTLAKPPGTYRILGLGDSYLFGQGVRFNDVCLTRLQGLLQSASPEGVSVEAINTGMSAFNTENERGLLAVRGAAYAPDLVIVHFVLNDIEPDVFKAGPKIEFFREYTDLYIHPDWLSGYSDLWGLLRQRYLRQVAGSRYIQQCLDSYLQDPSKFERMWSAMEGIRDWCQEHDASLVVAVFPFLYQLNGNYPFRPIHEQMKRRCEAAGIAVLDLYPAFKSYSGPELWVHPVGGATEGRRRSPELRP
jgi:hypothetical protein